jgi:hypothetical protein
MIRVMSVIVFAVCAVGVQGCRGTERLTTEPLPTCLDVKGKFDPRAPGFIVGYKTGVDPIATTKQLENKYGFQATHVYTALAGFSAQLSSTAVVGVSCELSVASMEHDAIGTIASR